MTIGRRLPLAAAAAATTTAIILSLAQPRAADDAGRSAPFETVPVAFPRVAHHRARVTMPPSTATSNPTPLVPPTAATAPSFEPPPSSALQALAPPVPPSTIGTHSAGLAALASTTGAAPAHIHIDGIDVDGPVVPVAVDTTSGELAVAPDQGVVGWYQYGPIPGEAGSAVLASHLDWDRHPGVFFRLAQVPIGAVVTITYTDDSMRRFRVTDRQLVLKPALPVDEVFARDGPSTLRLVTCGGTYDKATHHYRSNVLVTAEPIA